ncbi:MAG: FHA domain-containing protein, partial [Armatimonadota bacterium]
AEAWLRVMTGRNEGKDHLLDLQEHVVGRSETADVPVYGDPAVARRHLIVRRAHGGWEAVDTGESPDGFRVNDRRVAGTSPLKDGDRIGVGGRTLQFRVRATTSPTVAARREPGRAPATPTAAAPLPTAGVRTAMGAGAPGVAGRLTAVSGPHAGAVFPVSGTVEIGRDVGVAVSLPADRKASRRHATLTPSGDGWELVDNGSTNGTFVNGQRIQRLRLAPGDTLLVGETALRLDP